MTDADITFQDNNGSLVVILSHVLLRLTSYRQIHIFSQESAGVLIGERRGNHLVVCDLSEPGKGDISHRYMVNRKGKHHQAKVNSAYIKSGGTQNYLGEWHTHPEDFPAPSSTDKKSWEQNIKDREDMLLIIVGRKSLWAGKKSGRGLTRITQLKE